MIKNFMLVITNIKGKEMRDFTKRQNEIIQTSIKLISDKGIQNFTTKSLASLLGISEPAIYRHFSSKREILLSILQQIKEKSNELPNNTALLPPMAKKSINSTIAMDATRLTKKLLADTGDFEVYRTIVERILFNYERSF